MLIKVTTIGGAMLINTNVIDAATLPFEEKNEGSLLWLSKKNLPDAGYGNYGDELLWVEESLDEILALLAGGRE